MADFAHQCCAGGVKDEAQPEKRMMPSFEYAIVPFGPDANGIENEG